MQAYIIPDSNLSKKTNRFIDFRPSTQYYVKPLTQILNHLWARVKRFYTILS